MMMKKFIIGLTLMSSFLYLSCNKEDSSIDNKNSMLLENAISNSDINLDSFATTITTDPATGNTYITFAEPEDIVVHSDQANELGFSNLKISKGIYTINVSDNNYGELEMDVLDYDLISTFQPIEVGVGIIIAKKWKQCGGNGPLQYCACGVGFSCSFTKSTLEKATLMSAAPDRLTSGDVSFDPSTNKLKIIFTTPIPTN